MSQGNENDRKYYQSYWSWVLTGKKLALRPGKPKIQDTLTHYFMSK